MQNLPGYYVTLIKRRAWIVILGVVFCGSAAYIITQFQAPVYRASATLVVSLKTATSSSYDNFYASEQAVPTYAQLLTNPSVLDPVVAAHEGITLQQLSAMITVRPEPNTQLIELDVDNSDPMLATELANEIGQSFAQFSNAQFPGSIQVLPARQPTQPIHPRPLLDTAIGVLVGLSLALALIIVFEWTDDRLTSPEEVQKLLGMETLMALPRLSRRQRGKSVEEIPVLAEGYRLLCASLNMAQLIMPFKLVMVTSALTGEGKTTVAANLAFFLARAGKRVLLVDANLRCPVLDQHFQLEKRLGFASALLGMWGQADVQLNNQATDTPDLYVLTAEVPLPNSADLLQSAWVDQLFEQFKTAPFDYIIFDTAPLLPVADTQILASYVQATVLVVDASKTPRKELFHAKRLLNRTHIMTLGVVVNKSRRAGFRHIDRYLKKVRQSRTAITMKKPPETPPTDSQVDEVDIPADSLMDQGKS